MIEITYCHWNPYGLIACEVLERFRLMQSDVARVRFTENKGPCLEGEELTIWADGVVSFDDWRIDRGDYGQGLVYRVCRRNADCRADVWGHYAANEYHIAVSALGRARKEG